MVKDEEPKFLSIIVAMDIHDLIGADNDLPWPRIESDMKRFRELTRRHDVVMGRKTFESRPICGRPLSERHNIVISRSKSKMGGCTVAKTLHEATEKAFLDTEIFVIGGAEIYRLALQHAKYMYITTVHRAFNGDTYFPKWDESEWKKIEGRSIGALGEIATSFTLWERKKAPAPL